MLILNCALLLCNIPTDLLTATRNLTSLLAVTSTSVCYSKPKAQAPRHSVSYLQMVFFTKERLKCQFSCPISPPRAATKSHECSQTILHRDLFAISDICLVVTVSPLTSTMTKPVRFVMYCSQNISYLNKSNSATAQTWCWNSLRHTLTSMTCHTWVPNQMSPALQTKRLFEHLQQDFALQEVISQ